MRISSEKKLKLAVLAVLTVIVVLLQLLGRNIRIGDFSISLILLPVITGAVLCGPLGGAWLGFVFGAVLMMTGETDIFWADSPLKTIIDTAGRGAIAGASSGFVYNAVSRKKEDLARVCAAITAPIVNTVLFVLLGLLLFFDVFELILGKGQVLSGMIENCVSINFLIELALCMVLSPMLVRLAKRLEDPSKVQEAPGSRNRKKLATRLSAALVLLGILICAVSSINGYQNVVSSLKELSESTGIPVSIEDLEEASRSNITNSIVTMICIEVIFITLYSYYISYRVIAPVKKISEEVSGFVENETRSGEALTKIRTEDEIQQLAEDIMKMEKDIGDYISHITVITAERERIGTELNVARKIQADMLPSKFPAFPEHQEFDIYASMDPAKEVGGDFYDFFLLDEDHLALVIADVSDKSVPAALFMVVAKTVIKNQASFSHSPKEILEAVNRQLYENNTSHLFVTAWICIYEISTGKCVASNAGHEYPAIRKADGAFTLIKDIHGFVLGGIRKSVYDEYEFSIEKGGTVFVYTDGVPEAENAAEECFGMERMLAALNENSGAAPEEIIRNTREKINAFVGDAAQFDDITMLCIKRL